MSPTVVGARAASISSSPGELPREIAEPTPAPCKKSSSPPAKNCPPPSVKRETSRPDFDAACRAGECAPGQPAGFCGKSLLLDSLMQHGSRGPSPTLNRFHHARGSPGSDQRDHTRRTRYRRVTTGKLPEADLCFLARSSRRVRPSSTCCSSCSTSGTYEVGEAPRSRTRSRSWPSLPATGGPPRNRQGTAAHSIASSCVVRRPHPDGRGPQHLLWEPPHTHAEYASHPLRWRGHTNALALAWTGGQGAATEEILRERAVGRAFSPGPRVQVHRRGPGVRLPQRRRSCRPEHLEAYAHCLWDGPSSNPEGRPGGGTDRANPFVAWSSTPCSWSASRWPPRTATQPRSIGYCHRQVEGSTNERLLLRLDARVERARSYVREQSRRSPGLHRRHRPAPVPVPRGRLAQSGGSAPARVAEGARFRQVSDGRSRTRPPGQP